MHRVTSYATLALILVLSLAGCGKDSSPTAPTPTPPPQAATPRITVFGVVRSNIGGPVAGASIRITGAESTSGTTTSDGNGYYSVANIAAGNVTVTITAAGFADSSTTFTAQGDSQRDTTLTSMARYALLGVVRDEATGRPLANVSVTAVNVQTQTNVRATTDGGGFYHMAGIAPGPVNVDWTLFGHVSRSERMTFENGDIRRDLTLTSVQAPPPSTSSCGAPAEVTCINGGHRGRPTARCSDGAWSCSTTPSGTCSSHGGISCRVCPGPLCS